MGTPKKETFLILRSLSPCNVHAQAGLQNLTFVFATNRIRLKALALVFWGRGIASFLCLLISN